jgi:Ca2+-transporting ATPase
MLSGCIVCDGVGRMMVTCTGPDSVWGKAISKLTQEYEDTPLQTKLNVMAGMFVISSFQRIIPINYLAQIGKIGLAAATLTFIVLSIFWAVRLYGEEKRPFRFTQLLDLLDFFIIAVAIIVMAVPEGISFPFSFPSVTRINRSAPRCDHFVGLFYEENDER